MDPRVAALVEATSDLDELRAMWDEHDHAEWSDQRLDYPASEESLIVLERATGRESEILGAVRDRLHHVEQRERDRLTPFDPDDEDYQAVHRVLRRLSTAVVVDVINSVDFSLILRNAGQLRTEFQTVVFFLISVVGGDALDRDNHDGMGYHFHYVNTGGRRSQRTNVLL